MEHRRPSKLVRAARAAWWLLDASRRALFNLLLLALLGAGLWAAWRSLPEKLPEKTALVLDWRGAVVEQASGSLRDSVLARAGGGNDAQVRLRDVLAVLERAAGDDRIGSALLLLDDFEGAGLATLREIAAALERFKASGKPVVAWASAYDQRQYFIAAHASEVFVHPMGTVLIEGFGRYRNYYKDALDRLGLQAHVVRAGTYKNAPEPYMASQPSPQSLEAEAALFGGLWKTYTQGVEKARRLEAGAVQAMIDALPASLVALKGDAADLALQARLVDGLKTRDELRAMMIERGAPDDDGRSFRQVSFQRYLERVKPAGGAAAIGVVVAEGNIVDGDAQAGTIGGRSTAELVRKAREDEAVKALVLRVDSPGGSAFGSELVRREVELTRAAGKPVVVSMGDLAASGGYWIAMAADEVIADEATITGSIGVFAMLPTAERAFERLGVATGGATTTWLAGAYDPRRGLDPRFETLVRVTVERLYADFTAKAAAARKTTVERLDAVAQGRVWTGAQALERGLVDRTGSLGDALAAAAKRAGLAADTPVRYLEREPGGIGKWLQRMGSLALLALWDETSAPAAAVWPGAAGPLAPSLGLGAPVGNQSGAASGVADGAQILSDLRWLAAMLARGEAGRGLAHCLCSPP